MQVGGLMDKGVNTDRKDVTRGATKIDFMRLHCHKATRHSTSKDYSKRTAVKNKGRFKNNFNSLYLNNHTVCQNWRKRRRLQQHPALIIYVS